MTSTPLRIVNPLPRALAHYETALLELLTTAGVPAEVAASASAERDDHDARLRIAGRLLRSRWRLRHGNASLLVLWPAFGLADPAAWFLRQGPTSLIVHDPRALRRQYGMGRVAAAFGRYAGRRTQIIVHSTAAAEQLARYGWQSRLLPHPVRRPALPDHPRGDQLSVLGQWKPARDPRPLRALAADTNWTGRRHIAGRGWPEVAGWDVTSRFLTESEVDDRIRSSACVVLPYDYYFQSGVAARCLEQGTPVVGRRHPFLEDLFGSDWVGLVDDDGGWPGATQRAVAMPASEVHARAYRYHERCVRRWAEVAQELTTLSR